jgi:hypothetical protein
MSLKNPVTTPGIDPRTVQLVAQRLNHYATPGPQMNGCTRSNTKQTHWDTPCIHFQLRFRGICQSGIRTAMTKCCCSHISTQTSDFGVEPWTFYMELLPFISTTSHALAPLYVLKFTGKSMQCQSFFYVMTFVKGDVC